MAAPAVVVVWSVIRAVAPWTAPLQQIAANERTYSGYIQAVYIPHARHPQVPRTAIRSMNATNTVVATFARPIVIKSRRRPRVTLRSAL